MTNIELELKVTKLKEDIIKFSQLHNKLKATRNSLVKELNKLNKKLSDQEEDIRYYRILLAKESRKLNETDTNKVK